MKQKIETPRGRVITGSKVRLREKKLSDARNDYLWQSDPELARLDAAPVLQISFPIYLLEYSSLLHNANPNRLPLAVETLDGKHVGNCTCYDIDLLGREAQFGIMIGDRNFWDRGYGTDAVTSMVGFIFQTTGLRRIYLKTLDWNIRAQKCFEKSGFIRYGQFQRNGYNFILMEQKREHWEKTASGGEIHAVE